MNQLTICLLDTTAPQTRHAPDGLPIHELQAQIQPIKDGDPLQPITVVGFGETIAPQFQSVQQGAHVLVQGRVEIDKTDSGKVAKVIASRLWPSEGIISLNALCLVGRVGQDPDVRYFESGNVLARLSLAVNRPKRDAAPNWFNLEVWGKTAEVAANYVRKGSLIGIQGQLRIDQWQDRQSGGDRTAPSVRVDRLHLLGGRQEEQEDSYSEQARVPVSSPAAAVGGDDIGDIPF